LTPKNFTHKGFGALHKNKTKNGPKGLKIDSKGLKIVLLDQQYLFLAGFFLGAVVKS